MKDKEKYYHLIWPITNEQGNIFYGHDKFFFETLQLSKKRAKNRDIFVRRNHQKIGGKIGRYIAKGLASRYIAMLPIYRRCL